jgi:hypothetical protein
MSDACTINVLYKCNSMGQSKLMYPFSAKRTVISANFCRVLEGWVRHVVCGRVSREGGQDTGVGRSSSI